MDQPPAKKSPPRSRELTLKEKLEASIEWETARNRRARRKRGDADDGHRRDRSMNEAGGMARSGPIEGRYSYLVCALVLAGMVVVTWASIIGVYYALRWAGW